MLSLSKPIYECTSAYGHFGRKPDSNGSFHGKTDKSKISKVILEKFKIIN